ncbi:MULTISPECIES: hypothetical protein [Cytobacillus]|uniref:hypothetical protein n=1 Tax=Cytobacillus TaxID=2675230 RepID=UPI001FB8B942|nr:MULTISPECIES: hypothetical protein [Cytobacillus]
MELLLFGFVYKQKGLIEVNHIEECPRCKSTEFAEGTDFMPVKPLNKKLSAGSLKIYRFCLSCGDVVSIRIENPGKFRSR